MAFTYDLALTGEDGRISQVRMHIRDNIEGSGVLPTSANLQDAEIAQLLDDNDDNVLGAASDAAALVAASWANAADITVGPRRENLSQVADRWQKLSMELRKRASTGAGLRIRRLTQPDNYDVTEYTAG